jgi:hypothetical protein
MKSKIKYFLIIAIAMLSFSQKVRATAFTVCNHAGCTVTVTLHYDPSCCATVCSGACTQAASVASTIAPTCTPVLQNCECQVSWVEVNDGIHTPIRVGGASSPYSAVATGPVCGGTYTVSFGTGSLTIN